VANLHHGDALTWLRDDAGSGAGAGFDIAFVDPPFDAGLWPAVLELLPARLAADAWLYLESPADHTPALSAEWALHRESGTREVRYALYRRVTLAPIHHGGDPATT
jgi:16S rRNA (guanine966-N2)-methyltransferase